MQPQQPPPTMNELSSRFAAMQRRFVEFSERAHVLIRMWLSTQKTSLVEVSVDCLTDFLFSLKGEGPSLDAPMHWVKTIARSALEDQMACVPNVKYGGSGTSFIFNNIPETLAVSWPVYARTCVAIRIPEDDISALRRRNTILEVRVLDLETKLSAANGSTRFTTTKTVLVHPPPVSSQVASSILASSCSSTIPDTVQYTNSFLLEKRFDAEDAVNLLRRVQSEFEGRKRVLDMIHSDQEKRHAETRRTDAKKSRNGMALITDELLRLKSELQVSKASSQKLPSTAASVVSSSSSSSGHLLSANEFNGPIVPRRALVIAGFWNVSHNDVLLITPHLVAKFKERLDSGKKNVIKHKESQVCFQVEDPKVLIDVVIETMSKHLPLYERIQPAI